MSHEQTTKGPATSREQTTTTKGPATSRELTIVTQDGTTKPITLQPGGAFELFYSKSRAEARCIGHMRFDVDSCGKLWTSWWPHQAAQQHNRQPFKGEFDAVIIALQQKLFSDPKRIQRRMTELGLPTIDEDRHYYGFHIDTEAYSYYLRVFPHSGDYSYCYCYVRGDETCG